MTVSNKQEWERRGRIRDKAVTAKFDGPFRPSKFFEKFLSETGVSAKPFRERRGLKLRPIREPQLPTDLFHLLESSIRIIKAWL